MIAHTAVTRRPIARAAASNRRSRPPPAPQARRHRDQPAPQDRGIAEHQDAALRAVGGFVEIPDRADHQRPAPPARLIGVVRQDLRLLAVHRRLEREQPRQRHRIDVVEEGRGEGQRNRSRSLTRPSAASAGIAARPGQCRWSLPGRVRRTSAPSPRLAPAHDQERRSPR